MPRPYTISTSTLAITIAGVKFQCVQAVWLVRSAPPCAEVFRADTPHKSTDHRIVKPVMVLWVMLAIFLMKISLRPSPANGNDQITFV